MRPSRLIHASRPAGQRPAALAQGGWFVLAFFAAGLCLLCLIPLSARLSLLRQADGFVPSTLTVEHFSAARQREGGRIFAHGVLPDGRPARVQVLRDALPQRADGSRERPHALDTDPATPAVELAVRVNPALDGGWLHRDQVLLGAIDWPARWRRQVLQLLALMVGGAAVAVWAGRRFRAAQRRG